MSIEPFSTFQLRGWQKVGSLLLESDVFWVEVTDPRWAYRSQLIYALLTRDGAWVRIGKSDKPLGQRMRRYAKDLARGLACTKDLNLKEGSTKRSEMPIWLDFLEGGPLTFWAIEPPTISTDYGDVVLLLDLERHLIRKIRPPLNRELWVRAKSRTTL